LVFPILEKTARVDLPNRKINLRQPIEVVLGDRRREWLKLVQAMPNASRRDLINTSYYLYFWLKRNDSEWFETHLPPPRRVVCLISLIDWKSIDNELSAAVKASAIRIKNQPGRPIRASITSIIKEVGRRSWIEKRLDKLPLTAKVIKEFVESLEAFEIRKVLCTAECYMRGGFCPTRAQFIMRAGVKNKTGRTPAVQSTINAAMERLSKELH
jgi:hypothetical protein